MGIVTPLLIPAGTVNVPATTVPFMARDHFVVNTRRRVHLLSSQRDGLVRIDCIFEHFREWFLNKEEPPFNGSTLKYEKLSRRSTDGPIIAEIGGEEEVETTLTEVFALLQAQPNGENGSLTTDGLNIFYVRDARGILRTVLVVWVSGGGDCGWDLDAYAVPDHYGYNHGEQIFSRSSRELKVGITATDSHSDE